MNPQKSQSHPINFCYPTTDYLFQNTNLTDLVDDGMQVENRDISDDTNQVLDEQVNNAPDSETQQDWDKHEIEQERGGGQTNKDEEIEILKEANDQLESIASNQTHNPSLSNLTNASTSSNERHSYHNLTNSETEKESDQVIKEKVEKDENGKSRFDKTIETTPPHSSSQSKRIMKIVKTLKRKQTHDERQQPNEVNNRDIVDDDDVDYEIKRPRSFTLSSIQENQIISINLRCPQGCGMFAKDDFYVHMWKRHSIRPFRCPVKECDQSFENTLLLGQHITHSHKHTIQWHCDKCDTKYTSYLQLSNHNILYHQLGHFQCSFSECTFTGDHRKKVYNHYAQQHKATFNCQQCEFRTLSMTNLQQHKRIHSDIKPY